jgi:hypothetical protein
MNHQAEMSQALDFLQEQVKEAEHKVARLEDAFNTCNGCQESDGLRTMLHTAELERDALQALLKNQSGTEAVSLDAAIMQHANQFHQRASQLSGRWQRGHPTPAGYWEAESQRAFLLETLCRYHAWQAERAGRPFATNGSDTANGTAQANQNHAHPWFDTDERPAQSAAVSNTAWMLEELHQKIEKALAKIKYPEHHLDIVVQAPGQVIITGQAHSDENRELALNTIMDVDNIREVVSDIKVVAEPDCPVCHPEPLANGQ